MVNKPEEEQEANLIPDLHLDNPSEITPEMIQKEWIVLCKIYSEMGEQFKKLAIMMSEYSILEGGDVSGN